MKKALQLLKAGFTCCYLLLSSVLFAQPQFEWAKAMGGQSFTYSYGQGITSDKEGNVYTVGNFGGKIHFDLGSGTDSLISHSFSSIFISKINKYGDYLWVRKIGTTEQNPGITINATYVQADELGNVYVSGSFNSTESDSIDFDPGHNVFNVKSAFGDAYLLKLDSSGNFLWVRTWGGGSEDMAIGPILKNGFLYCTGTFRGSNVDFDPSETEYAILSSNGEADIYISKFDTAGNFIWVKGLGGKSTESARHIVLDSSENIYITGEFTGLVDFDPAETSTYHLDKSNGNARYILKLRKNGDFVWATQHDQNIHSIATDASSNLYLVGNIDANYGTLDVDPGPGTVYLNSSGTGLIKLDSLSNFKWGRIVTSISSPYSRIHLDTHGNIYTSGSFNQTSGIVDVDPDLQNVYNLNLTNGNYYISKLSSDTRLLWAVNMGTPSLAAIGGDISSLFVDYAGNIYTTGGFGGVNRDFGIGTNKISTIGSGTGIFIHKMSCPTSIESISVMECSSYDFFGETLTQSGTYTHTIPNVAGGCDSAVELILTIPVIDAVLTEKEGILTANTTGAIYQWVDCNSNTAINGETSQNFTPTADGQYAVIVTLGGCSDTSDCIDFKVEGDVISIRELDSGNTIVLYPNPTEGQVHLKTGRDLQNATATFFNIAGQQLLQRQGLQGDRFSFDISTYTGGVYFMEISEQGHILRMKFTVR